MTLTLHEHHQKLDQEPPHPRRPTILSGKDIPKTPNTNEETKRSRRPTKTHSNHRCIHTANDRPFKIHYFSLFAPLTPLTSHPLFVNTCFEKLLSHTRKHRPNIKNTSWRTDQCTLLAKQRVAPSPRPQL